MTKVDTAEAQRGAGNVMSQDSDRSDRLEKYIDKGERLAPGFRIDELGLKRIY